MIHRAIYLILFLFTPAAFPHSDHKENASDSPQVLAPGYRALNYDAPAPGTYQLPPLGQAGGGEVLNMQGRRSSLLDLMGDKIVILSFIYTSCDDINGCPLATYVCSVVQNRLQNTRDLDDKVRFISMSFDPANDTPAIMSSYGKKFANDDFDWQFLTTNSEADLSPILSAYDQSIQRDVDEQGQLTGSFSHILRVFLIDKQKRIRNIYSTSFLHPDTVINDIHTLILEEQAQFASMAENTSTNDSTRHGAGDYKEGYENENYETRALSLSNRTGIKQNLLKNVERVPMGLPAVPVPVENPLTQEKIDLGRRLFFDRRLSHNDTISCAICHIPEQGFTSNELATAVGIEGRTVRRNTPTIYNVSYANRLFHDARETTLEQQIWGPLLARNEMGNPSIGHVIEKIKTIKDYDDKFEAVFDGKGPGMETVGMALASYQRTLVSANSPFDHWYYKKEQNALAPAAIRGYKLFSGKARCISCHNINDKYALFTDNKLHNTGVGYLNSMQKEPENRNVLVAPGTVLSVDTASIADSSELRPTDLGYYEITGNPDDRWKYKTPILRNVALTAPYMHDGSLSTLREVITFYNEGGIGNELLDPLIQPLNLDNTEIQELTVFLQSLTGDNINDIVSDAFAAPIGNTTLPE